MQIFKWKDEYLLGVDRLDSQHKQLVSLLNEAHLQCRIEMPVVDQNLTLLELVDYAV